MNASRDEIETFYADYVGSLDDGELERWPEFFTEECVYKIIPRENYDRDLPLALMLCESKGMLRDRVAALRRTSVYAPRALRHLVSSLRITADDVDTVRVRANYTVLQTRVDEPTAIFNAGRYRDSIVREDGRLKFKEKLCICDTVVIPGSLIYPL
jgi:3-phenylpropionate/cinnamic acid dioxygenase small subunit